ncbi:DUF748 domain-containing protein [Methylococcus geothermalis]|uniref:DUF748 domain-containing protein n=1 Tax=Methylococcus geothermalis TaxID=2681310 RepID=A0A858Q5S6_9GAMM|nr:DUF748 domain-containing protein [Methylococcus geothermalis]QJD29155.1 DUF748 domain-containing protein [Methylococcus geothermalis]
MKSLPQLVRTPWFKVLAAMLAAIGLYAAAGFVLLPRLTEHYAPKLAAAYLKRQLSIAEVGFNPFRFTLELKGVALKELSGANLLSLERLSLNLDPVGLARKTLTFSELLVEKPSVDLVIDPDGRLNLAKVADDLPEAAASERRDDKPLPLFFKRLAIIGGSARFTDRSGKLPVEETVDSIDVEVADLSTLPEVQGTQHLTATFREHGVLDWQGKISINPLYSDGEVTIGKLPLSALWPFVKERIVLAEPRGELGAFARYELAERQGGLSLSVSGMTVEIAGLKLIPERGSAPILALDRIVASDAGFDLESRKVRVPKFEVRKGHVRAAVDEHGEIDWLKLIKPASSGAGPAASSGQPGPPWQVEIDAFEIAEVGVDYADASRNPPVGLGVGAFELSFAADIEAGSGDPDIVISDLAARLDRIALTAAAASGQGKSLATLDLATVEGGRLDLSKREIAVGRIALQGGGTAVVRDAGGGIRLAEALVSKSQGDPSPQPPKAGGWRYAVQQFVLQDFGVTVADQTYTPEIAYTLDGMRLTLGPIASDAGLPIAFDAAFAVKQGGSFKASGTVSQSLDRADAEVRIDRIDMQHLHPLVARFAGLRLERADVSAQLQLGYRQEADTVLKAKGDVSVGELLLKETASGKRFLSWKNLSAVGVDFSLAHRRLAVKEVRIAEPGWHLEIFEDRSTNIDKILGGAARGTVPKAVKAPRRPEKPKPWLVTVESIRVDKGDIDFGDMSLVLPFATHIHDFVGAATGISTKAAARTMLQFHGQVDRYGVVNVYGQLSPLAPKNFGDVSVAFRNVDMPSLSPYSATFAGREMTSGKLNLDIRYQIDNGRLKNDNRIVLERLVLGERVESPKAVSLPLDLAIALLTDGEGKIDVSVPVEGDLGNPQFDYGHVIWDAFVNVVTKAVAAPFRALGRLVGGNGEEIGRVLFEPGSAVIEPPELEKLNKVMVALAQRPQLSLEVHGGVDPERDGRALKSLQVRRALAAKLDFRLSPGEEAGPIPFDSAATQLALEDLADERGGPGAADQVQAAYEKAGGKKVDRVGRVSALMGRPSADQGFYRALFDHLVETASLSPQALEDLAARRAQAVASELTKQGRVDGNRVEVGKTVSGDVSDQRIVTKLDLNVAGG